MILIDMKMPRTCAACEWSDYLHPNAYCRREQTTVNIETAKTSRPEWCPLIEVHAHGRLIDVDALLDEWGDYTGFYRMKRKITEEDLIQMIRRQPIVVMPEGEINERN